MVKGIIFDLDGTLIDSMQVWYDVDRRFLRENGVSEPPEDISDRVKISHRSCLSGSSD